MKTQRDIARLVLTGLLAGATTFLAGCSSQSNGLYSQYYQALRQGLGGSFSRSDVTRDQAAAIPYASMGYRIDGGAETILLLGTDSGGTQLWTAGNHVVIQTSDGRITHTVGLQHDLGGLSPLTSAGTPPLLAAVKSAYTSQRLADFPDSGAYSVLLSCTARARGPETVTILGQGVQTLRVDEACRGESLRWSFVNSYWLDPQSGMAWRTIQHLSPKGATIETEIFRPPG